MKDVTKSFCYDSIFIELLLEKSVLIFKDGSPDNHASNLNDGMSIEGENIKKM